MSWNYIDYHSTIKGPRFSCLLLTLQNGAFVETTVENTTQMLLSLHDIVFDVDQEGLRVEPIFPAPTRETGSEFSENEVQMIMPLRPRDSVGLLHRFHAINPSADAYKLKTLCSLGSMSIGYHIANGEGGSLHSLPIQFEPEALRPVELRLKQSPPLINVEVPFEVHLECVNRSSTVVRTRLNFTRETMAPVYVIGSTSIPLDPIGPQEVKCVAVQLVAIVPGLQHIKGVSLVNRTDDEILCNPDFLGSIWVL